MALTISSLLADYRSGRRTPSQVLQAALTSVASDPTYANAWIHRVPEEMLMRRAAELEASLLRDPGVLDRLPLYGVPYAVKDNIDVAGVPTTAACPAFSHVAQRSAAVVEKLDAAGAVMVGKTNLDQFATGLVGARSPYGAVANSIRPQYISGGSSSGSAVAVARGMVSFALGTDTAGSGRVPAGLNNIVGLKPSRGLISARGVVPACQSVDCVSLLALTAADAVAVLDVAAGFDAEDPYSRELAPWPTQLSGAFRFALPEPLEFYGDQHTARAFEQAVRLLEDLGGAAMRIDFSLFQEAASLLYEGPWVAERMAAIRPFYERHADQIHPVVREIIGGAQRYSAADLFQSLTRLQILRRETSRIWQSTDVIVVPTVPTVYTIEAVLAEPFQTNRRLGLYTNYVNLLDLAAFAVPVSMRADGVPCGITLIGPAGSDRMLADLAQRFHQSTGLRLGALDEPLPPPSPLSSPGKAIKVAVVGAHLSGLPLNHELTARGARLNRATRTATAYALYALPGTAPAKPGLVRDASGAGRAIALEVWEMPVESFGAFVAGIASPLGIGRIELEDGDWVQGFLCESWALAGARNISEFGGWRAYLERGQA